MCPYSVFKSVSLWRNNGLGLPIPPYSCILSNFKHLVEVMLAIQSANLIQLGRIHPCRLTMYTCIILNADNSEKTKVIFSKQN